MGNVKMEMNGKYQTSDLYLAAYLLSMGLDLLNVDHGDRQDRPELSMGVRI